MKHKVMGPNWTQAEGFVLGVGAKMFTIAGPVIVYGVSVSVVIYWLFLWSKSAADKKEEPTSALLLLKNNRKTVLIN